MTAAPSILKAFLSSSKIKKKTKIHRQMDQIERRERGHSGKQYFLVAMQISPLIFMSLYLGELVGIGCKARKRPLRAASGFKGER